MYGPNTKFLDYDASESFCVVDIDTVTFSYNMYMIHDQFFTRYNTTTIINVWKVKLKTLYKVKFILKIWQITALKNICFL